MIPESVRKIIDKLECPYLSLEEQLQIADVMLDCRNKIIQIIYKKGIFNRRIAEKLELEGDSSQITHFTLDQVTKAKAKRMINKYLHRPSLKRAIKLNLNYVFVVSICEEYLDKQSNIKLQEILKTYYDARDKLVNSMVKNIVSICQHYVGSSARFEDLFQTAMLALIESTGRYSKSMGYKFDTFATWWVRYELQHFMRKDNIIKVPFRYYTAYVANSRKIQKQEQEESRRIRNPIELPQFKHDAKTDANPGEDLDNIFDHIADDRYKEEETKVILKSILLRKLARVDNKSRDVITRLFGLDCDPMTPKQIGIELDMPSRSVTYMARSALRQLKLISDIKFPK